MDMGKLHLWLREKYAAAFPRPRSRRPGLRHRGGNLSRSILTGALGAPERAHLTVIGIVLRRQAALSRDNGVM
jgi:hypothetical protein